MHSDSTTTYSRTRRTIIVFVDMCSSSIWYIVLGNCVSLYTVCESMYIVCWCFTCYWFMSIVYLKWYARYISLQVNVLFCLHHCFYEYCDGVYYFSYATVCVVCKRVMCGVCIYGKIYICLYEWGNLIKIGSVFALYLFIFVSLGALFWILIIRSHQLPMLVCSSLCVEESANGTM